MKHFELYNLCVQHINKTGGKPSCWQLVQDINQLSLAELAEIKKKIDSGSFFDESGEFYFLSAL